MTKIHGPGISILSCFSSDFIFEIHVSVVGLIPSEEYELWAFFPDGEAIGGQRVRSDERGCLRNMQGGQNISFRFHSSSAIPRGLYTLGIIRGEFIFNKKPYISDWKQSSNEKSYLRFPIPYQNQLILKIEGVGVNLRGLMNIIFYSSLYLLFI